MFLAPGTEYVNGVTSMRSSGRVAIATIAVLSMAAVVAGCGSPGSDPGAAPAGPTASSGGHGRPVIMATTSIWADVVSHVACDGLADVETVVPIGGDPHSAEPSLADGERMRRAATIVANGLQLEEGLQDTLESVEGAGTPVFRMGDHVDVLHGFSEDGPSGGKVGESGDEGGADPHIWFDPVRVSAALPALADHLVQQAGLDADRVAVCLEHYQAELAATDSYVTTRLAAVPSERRKLVTNHDSLRYFADRYHFEIIGAVIPSSSTLAASNPAQLDRLAALITDAGVPAIFAEAQHATTDSDALAHRVGPVEVVTLYSDSLGPPASGADSYTGLLRADADMIAQALS